MRTLERIKLQHFEGINESEQKGMKGGDGNWEWSDEFGTYMLPEVYVYAPKPECPTCKAFDSWNNPYNAKNPDSGSDRMVGPIVEYAWKELANHIPTCGWYD